MAAVINAAKKLPMFRKQIDVSYTALVSWLIPELALMPGRVCSQKQISPERTMDTHGLGCGMRLYK